MQPPIASPHPEQSVRVAIAPALPAASLLDQWLAALFCIALSAGALYLSFGWTREAVASLYPTGYCGTGRAATLNQASMGPFCSSIPLVAVACAQRKIVCKFLLRSMHFASVSAFLASLALTGGLIALNCLRDSLR